MLLAQELSERVAVQLQGGLTHHPAHVPSSDRSSFVHETAAANCAISPSIPARSLPAVLGRAAPPGFGGWWVLLPLLQLCCILARAKAEAVQFGLG